MRKLVRRIDMGIQSTWGCTNCPWEIEAMNPRDSKEVPKEVQQAFDSHKCKTTKKAFTT